MNTNNKKVVSQAVFMFVGMFVVLCVWDWVESGNSKFLANAIAAVLVAFGSVYVDKVLLKQ
jgi:uncharacterized membrane protein YjjB (DUF3815 family)